MAAQNEKLRVVVVGGVAGGASAAARVKRLNENADVVVFEKGSDVSFSNCGLPYYLSGTVAVSYTHLDVYKRQAAHRSIR